MTQRLNQYSKLIIPDSKLSSFKDKLDAAGGKYYLSYDGFYRVKPLLPKHVLKSGRSSVYMSPEIELLLSVKNEPCLEEPLENNHLFFATVDVISNRDIPVYEVLTYAEFDRIFSLSFDQEESYERLRTFVSFHLDINGLPNIEGILDSARKIAEWIAEVDLNLLNSLYNVLKDSRRRYIGENECARFYPFILNSRPTRLGKVRTVDILELGVSSI